MDVMDDSPTRYLILYLHLNKIIRSFLSLILCLIPLTPIFHDFSLPLLPSSLLFLPLSVRGFAAQLEWPPSGVVKYKYNKDVFVLVNPFWAEKHHHRAHRCGTQSGGRERRMEKRGEKYTRERSRSTDCIFVGIAWLVIRTLHTNLPQHQQSSTLQSYESSSALKPYLCPI